MSGISDEEAGLSPLKRALLAVQDLTSRLEAAKRVAHEPIAIVGVSCRFPGGANDPDRFWELLREGREGVGEIPADRWDVDAFYDPDPDAPGKMYTRSGAFLDRPVDRFDARFFEIAPREAAVMDPQQRLLLELAWEAFENAGYASERLAGSRTGVFVGISTMDYAIAQVREGGSDPSAAYATTGSAFSVAAGRISYLLGLQGPNVAVDTACSSSLVAVALAVQSLRDGHSDMALAGGVNLILTPEAMVGMCKLRALAPDAHCKTFDAGADGYVRGEGGGVVVLKRLSDALAARDHIHAVIRGIGVNHDGRSSGLTVPNASAQQAVLRAALADAGASPEHVQYLEAHGTGTSLGDPIEVHAAAAVLGRGRDAGNLLALGSVKTNFGHLEAAAGMAGLIKLVLSLKHREIPPHLHLRQPTPHVEWDELPLVIHTRRTAWARGERPRLGGVSSFGFSGTNVHVLVEEAPATRPVEPAEVGPARAVHVLPISAKSEAALLELAARYADHLERTSDRLTDICHTASEGRQQFAHRLAVAGSTAEQLRDALRGHLRGEPVETVRAGHSEQVGRPGVAFLFAGHGAQYVGMGRGLFRSEPVFREALEECDRLLQPHLERSLLSVLYPEDETGEGATALLMEGMTYSQPALFAVEYALAQLWRSWGVEPVAVLGHSLGEYVAAVVAGVFSLADGIKLVAARGRLMDSLPGDGAMLAVFMTEEEVAPVVEPFAGEASIAVINAPGEVVISGRRTALERIETALLKRGVEVRWVPVAQAAHSPLLDPILAEFEAIATTVRFQAPRLPIVSCTTGALADAARIQTARYWRDHLREPVRFVDALRSLARLEARVFVEIGPHGTFGGKVRASLADGEFVWIPSLRRGQEDELQLGLGLAALHASGAPCNWGGLNAGHPCRKVPLPTYPFQTESFWFNDRGAARRGGLRRVRTGNEHPLLGTRLRSPALRDVVFEAELDLEDLPLLADHVVFDTAIFPATGYVEAVLAAAHRALEWTSCEIVDFEILQPLPLLPSTPRTMQVILSPGDDGAHRFRVVSGLVRTEGDWTEHATGTLRLGTDEEGEESALAETDASTDHPVDVRALYEGFSAAGIRYGNGFRGIEEAWAAPGNALGRLRIVPNGDNRAGEYHLHPGLLDSCLQLIAAALPAERGPEDEDAIYLPAGFRRLRFHRGSVFQGWGSVALVGTVGGSASLDADVRLRDVDGLPLVEIQGLRLARASRRALLGRSPANVRDWFYRLDWRPAPLAPPATAEPGNWVVLADESGVAEQVVEQLEAAGARVTIVRNGAELVRDDGNGFPPNPRRLSDVERVIGDARAGGPLAGVVHFWALDKPAGAQSGGTALQEDLTLLCEGVVRLVRLLAAGDGSTPPAMWLVTRATQWVEGERAPVALASASLWGLGRTILQEYPAIRCTLLDLEADDLPPISAIVEELLARDTENQVALRGGSRFALRLVRKSDAPAGAPLERPGSRNCALRSSQKGLLESLELAPVARHSPRPGEVEIRVRAAGLNFRDVLNALGTYPGDAGELGGECVGEVVAVGSGVTRFHPGDAVYGLATRSFGDHATTSSELLAPIPPGLSWTAAAAVPIAFLTARLGLLDVALLAPGESVLIHAAAGGVGLAALQIARQAGATILATAGSARKRRYLRALGVEHVFDSRSLDFADQVREATEGRGVDAVLNSLAGEFVPATLDVLAHGGRFVEVGKLNVWSTDEVSRRRPDVAFTAVDLAQLAIENPAQVGGMLDELSTDLAAGRLRPLPVRTFPLEHAVDAFRFMAQARHIGKIVLANASEADGIDERPIRTVRPDATYLVTGGLGGLGLAVARWLAERGARRLALVGRSAPSPEARAVIAEIEATGAVVVTPRADVANLAELERALTGVDTLDHPLRGVVHAAGVLRDTTLANLDRLAFETVLAPKVAGSWNLHEITRDRPLDFFVLFSSASSMLGSAGQANYAAANAFLDALACERRARGLPAQTINWAAWREVGLAASGREGLDRRLAEVGIETISPEDGCRAFGEALDSGDVQLGVLPIQLPRLAARFPAGTEPPLLRELLLDERLHSSADEPSAPGEVLAQLSSAPADRRVEILIGYLQARLTGILGLGGSATIRATAPLAQSGLDSLMVVELRNSILRDVQVELPAREIFEAPDLATLARCIAAAIEETSGDTQEAQLSPRLVPVVREGPLQLSFAQQRLWFLQQMNPQSTAYNVHLEIELAGPLDLAALERSFGELVARHESLRTTFRVLQAQPVQVIAAEASFDLEVVDLGACAPERRETEVGRWRRDVEHWRFDLERGPLFRAWLLRLGEGKHLLLVGMHHVITDGWSLGLISRELGVLYAATSVGAPSPLPALPVQYVDYAAWQREHLSGGLLERELSYWTEHLSELSPLELPLDRPRPPMQSYRGASLLHELPEPLSRRLDELSQREGVTLFMTLVSAFQVLLGRLSGQEDFAVGSPIAGRTRAQLEPLIGAFINNLVLRADLSGEPSFRELLARVRETTLGAYSHQEIPFEKLIEEINPPRDRSRTPFFQVLFNLLPYEKEAPVNWAGGLLAEYTPRSEGHADARFDLTLYAHAGDRLRLGAVYNADLFDADRIRAMLHQFEGLLGQAVEHPELPIADFVLAPVDPPGARPDPRFPLKPVWSGSVAERIAAHALATPDRIAVEDERGLWSYAELDEAGTRLANRLLADGLRKGDVVAVHADRAASLVVALLGIMRAGGAYLILDPAYPDARLIESLDQVTPRAFLKLEGAGAPSAAMLEHIGRLGIGMQMRLPDDKDALRRFLHEDPAKAPEVEIGPEDLAYVAFTSGTTGTPRGILGTHRPISHFLEWHGGTFGLGEQDRFSVLSGLAHDPLLRDLFAALWVGGAVCVPSAGTMEDPRRLVGWMAGRGITVAHLTPSMGQLLELGAEDGEGVLPALRLAFFGGDVLAVERVRGLRRLAPGARCVNFYGATETPQAMGFEPVEEPLSQGTIPLGRGIEGVQLLVLDSRARLCAVGEVGELHVRTPYLALGYVGDASATAERFVTNPYTEDARDRLYRTGDRARYLPDGRIVFAGRADQQVKIRGYRIEAGEVEAKLAEHPALSRAVVLARESVGGERQLVAYLEPAAGASCPPAAELREWLRARLPVYMVPTLFVPVERIPLTPNGKVDRRALDRLEIGSLAPESESYVAPRTPAEELLAGIWGELLGAERVGVHESFFDLGGHSLLVMQLVSRVREVFGVELPLRSIFDGPTIEQLAGRIEELGRLGAFPAAPPLERVPREGDLALSFSQERLWFLQQMEPQSTAYNLHGGVRLRGALNLSVLERSFTEIVRRHESLRTTFREKDGVPAQVIAPEASFRLEVVDLSDLEAEAREAEVGRWSRIVEHWVFDLARGPLFRGWLLRLGEGEHLLLLSMHHVITDGLSLQVLTSELRTLYEAFLSDAPSPLSELPVQYADYAAWQRAWLSGEVLEAQLGYWSERLRAVPALELPSDHPRPIVQSFRGGSHALELPAELSAGLRRLSAGADSTLFMTLLAAFQVLLGRLSGQEDFAVGSPIAGRTRAELEPLIGFFLNNLVLRADLSEDPSFRDLLGRVRETTLGAYAHQEIPFEKLLEELRPPRDLSRTPFFQVLFNLLPPAREDRASLGGLTAETSAELTVESKFDLTLYVTDGDRIHVRLVYNADLFEESSAASMLEALRILLESVVEVPDRRISTLRVQEPVDRLLRSAAAETPRLGGAGEGIGAEALEGSIGAFFGEVAARDPEAVAIEGGAERWTYAELDRRSDQVAHGLTRALEGSGAPVALYLEHDAAMVCGVLGSLKAGCAYVPLDPSYPAERLGRVVENSGAGLILTVSAHAEAVAAWSALPVVLLEEVWARETDGALALEVAPDTVAYLLYTSGSTGEPKAVVQSHRNVLHHVRTYVNRLGIGVGDRLSLVSAYGFDAAVMDLFGALLSGATLCPIDLRGEAAADLAGVVRSRGLSVYHSTPTVYRHLVGQLADGEVLEGVRLVVLGGEEAVPRDFELFRRHFEPGAFFVNGLGPTECTLALQQFLSHQSGVKGRSIPVGYPVEGVEVRLENAAGEPVETYATGELVVRSRYLALGYWKRPELTAAAFAVAPEDPEVRTYRMGDLGRLLPDGSIVFAGRADQQVKIRGYRIEAGEVEAKLSEHPALSRAVVLARESVGGERQLAAYLEPAAGASCPPAAELREWLRARLPVYMVPTLFVPVERIPLTPNGKVDRRALEHLPLTQPAITLHASAGGPASGTGANGAERIRPFAPDALLEALFVPPSTPSERLLAVIWQDLLGLEHVGATDNFYDLGGHSLLTARFVARVESAVGVRPNLRDIPYQTLAQIAASLPAPQPVVTPSRWRMAVSRIGRGLQHLVGRNGSAEK